MRRDDGLAPHPRLGFGIGQPFQRRAGQIDEIRRHQRQHAGRKKLSIPAISAATMVTFGMADHAPTRWRLQAAAPSREDVIVRSALVLDGNHASPSQCGERRRAMRLALMTARPLRNLITDVPGLKVGHAEDVRLGSGATAVIFDEPAVASIDMRGGGPGTRETALLDPAQTVEGINAITLSGGSAFGLDAASGVQAWLREQGRGFAVRTARVPIVPAAILFDLLSGGDKDWGRYPPYRELGYAAAAAAAHRFRARQRRRRHRRHHGQLQGRHRLGIGAKPGRHRSSARSPRSMPSAA